MIYEIRTYNLKTGKLHEYWERFSEKLPGRQEFSPLGDTGTRILAPSTR